MQNRTYRMISAALFAALTAVGAFIRVPFVPVSFTLQIFFVLFAGLLLGPKAAFASQILYLLMGLAGLPVFAGGGGLQYVFQPSFGYLVGFAAAAPVTGLLAEKARKFSFTRLFVSCLAGLAVIYLFGVTWLYVALRFFSHAPAPVSGLLTSGFLIFLPGDVLKIAAASFLAVEIRKRLKQI